MDRDVDYSSGAGGIAPARSLDHIPDPEMCCAFCHGIPDCAAWVWKDGGLDGCPYQCWILARAPVGLQRGALKSGAVSGSPPGRPHFRPPDNPGGSLIDGPDAGSYIIKPAAALTAATKQEAQVQVATEADALAGCATDQGNCWNGRCCQNPSHRCYMKNKLWAGCRQHCTPGLDPTDPPEVRTPWTCLDVTKAGTTERPSTTTSRPGLGPHEIPEVPYMAHPGPPPPTADLTLPAVALYKPLAPLVQEAVAPGKGSGPGLPGTTLFCFALSQPSGYEPSLIKAQFDMKTGIFACEAFAVYSNRAFEVAPGVATSVVPDSLKCPVHEIAWNTGIFLAVWSKVIAQAWYRQWDWTVKVDPDAVFFPDRLQRILLDHIGVGYLNNCQYGLHGPIEVLARSAMDVLAKDFARSPSGKRPQTCMERYPQSIVGDAQWGEDMFLDICLRTVLNVRADLDSRLICEAHCDCPDWYWCHNGTSRVTYHPFKDVDMFRQCVANAMFTG